MGISHHNEIDLVASVPIGSYQCTNKKNINVGNSRARFNPINVTIKL